MQTSIPKLLTMPEVCKILGRSRASIYLDVKAGRLPHPLKIGASVRWPSSEILAVIDRAKRARDEAEAA